MNKTLVQYTSSLVKYIYSQFQSSIAAAQVFYENTCQKLNIKGQKYIVTIYVSLALLCFSFKLMLL